MREGVKFGLDTKHAEALLTAELANCTFLKRVHLVSAAFSFRNCFSVP